MNCIYRRCENRATGRDGLCTDCAVGIADELQSRRSIRRGVTRLVFPSVPRDDCWGAA